MVTSSNSEKMAKDRTDVDFDGDGSIVHSEAFVDWFKWSAITECAGGSESEHSSYFTSVA